MNITAEQFGLIQQIYNDVTDYGNKLENYKNAASVMSDKLRFWMPQTLPEIAYNGGITPKAFWNWYENLEKEYYQGRLINSF